MTLSLARRGGGYYQVFLAHGVAVGLGAGLLFTPSVTAAAACLPHAPTRARTMGLMASGSSVGGVVYPLMFRHLVPQIGFPWTVRAIAFVMLGLYLVSYLVFLDYRPTPRAVRQFLDSSAFADLPFMTISLASLLSAVAFYIPLLCVPLYAATKIPAIGAGLTLDLLPIMNGASFAGRILAGLAAAVFGPTETITVSLVFGSVMLFAWITVDTVAGIIAWSVWGMISGILVTLPGAFIPLFCPSLSVLGTRSGMYWIWVGLGMLIGNPIAGAIHDLTSLDDDWWRLQVFAAVFMLAAALVNIYPVIHIRRKASATA
ncbi:major facilitator superfamily domain-containing protein [Xylariomycetidae sp. FL0641]|nr:major facilitator superfamily domain-containing protein [Xylariomycetidae sp. FL0641]